MIDKDGSKTVGLKSPLFYEPVVRKSYSFHCFLSQVLLYFHALPLQVSYWRPYFRLSLKVHQNHTFSISTPGVSYFPGHHGPIKSASTHTPACPRCRLSADW